MTTPTREQVTSLLARSDAMDVQLRLRLRAWREGYAAAERAHDDDYERGVHDGALARKRAEHDLLRMAQMDAERWGPLGREHFADPRPGDFQGDTLPLERAGGVWLAGPEVHRHECSRACRAYQPGWYSHADAASILSALPGDYSAQIADLRGQTGVAA